MSFIAFPLRLKDGLLRRCEEQEAIVTLLRIMATTTCGSWKGNLDFGLCGFFQEARARSEQQQRSVQKLNRALQDLGIVNYRVEAITPEAKTSLDADAYVLTLIPTSEDCPAMKVKLEL